MAFLCWLGLHRFAEGWIKYGSLVTCEKCGDTFKVVRDGSTDMARFDRVGR